MVVVVCVKTGKVAVEGRLVDASGERQGWLFADDGVVTEIGTGQCPVDPDITGFIVTDVLNMHTHCADYGLDIPPGMSLEDLVAPPDGLKHRYLREASYQELSESMSRFSVDSRGFGSTSFVDFREGGVDGCRMLRDAVPDAVILGRPISERFDPEEVDEILSVADGIGISSISDMDHRYIESVADMVRDRNMVLGIHVSERVREDIDFVLSLDPTFVVHMCEATDEDLLKCAEAEVPVVFCPTSNVYFGKVPPIARAQYCGVDIAMGTDNGMLCVPDMFQEAGKFAIITDEQGGDSSDFIQVLTRLSAKILKSQSHPVSRKRTPVTVLPSQDLDAAEALTGGSTRLSLERRR